MRDYICKRCGRIYRSDKEDSAVCPECAMEIRRDVLRDKVCDRCGRPFVGYPRSKYCPECRLIVMQENNRRYKKNGPARPIGSTDLCQNCGKPYAVTGSLQKYCPECAKTVVRENIRRHGRELRRKNADAINAAKVERRKGRRACAVCGNPITAKTPTVTCSPECAAILKRRWQAAADAKRGKANPARILGKMEHTKPQSGIPGINWLRGRWQLTYKGKYIGLFATVEDAAQRKKS